MFSVFYSSQRSDSENDSVLDDSERDESQNLGQVMAQGVLVNGLAPIVNGGSRKYIPCRQVKKHQRIRVISASA